MHIAMSNAIKTKYIRITSGWHLIHYLCDTKFVQAIQSDGKQDTCLARA